MTRDEKNFRLKIKKLPTFENNVSVKFDSRQRKKIPTFFPLFGNFFDLESEIFSFVSSQILRKRYSQMSAIFYLESEIFPSSWVKFYANVILKCRQFFLSQVGNFFLRLDSKIQLKIKKLSTFENNVCVKFDLRQRRKFPTFLPFVSCQILCKRSSQMLAFFYLESNTRS